MNSNQIVRLLPLQYSHVLDLNHDLQIQRVLNYMLYALYPPWCSHQRSIVEYYKAANALYGSVGVAGAGRTSTNITCLKIGPGTSVLRDNEKVVLGPVQMIKVPPGHYCMIENPVMLPVTEGEQCHVCFGQLEVRFHQEPFPLYPGEVLVGGNYSSSKGAIKKLPVIPPNHGLKLRALVDFDDINGKRIAGDEWQLEGPLTYYPRAEIEIVTIVEPRVIKHNEALLLRAKQDLVDHKGNMRVTGEEWLVRNPGAYLPGVYEEVVGVEKGFVLTDSSALHMKAATNCVDACGKKRIAGEEWLVTVAEKEHYIPEVGEILHSVVQKTVVGNHEFCIVVNPYDNSGKPMLGQRVLKTGVTSFFLQPGEELESGIQRSFILNEDEAVVVQAQEGFVDKMFGKEITRSPGDKWLIKGPAQYVPPVEVVVKDKRRAIPLDKNEGIYVRDAKSGEVRMEMGPQSYLLEEDEYLWTKELPVIVEVMLRSGGCHGEGEIRKLAYFESSIEPEIAAGRRNKSRVVKYRCPPNSAVQVYNHRMQTSRVIFGPDLVVLGPHENFNVLSLSAGKPKKNNALKSLAVLLGPDFITDVIEVETLDHARLRIQYAANIKFEYTKGDKSSEAKIFAVPDYIGFVCNSNASRIRGRVARTPFDEFHRYSARIVKESIFGLTKDGTIRPSMRFSENNLIITNVDIQSIEPVDRQMRDSLLKSVQLAIEISTNSIERSAAHEAARNDQVALGSLERSKLENEQAAEKARKELYELRAITAAVESSGQAKAEAEARAERQLIEGQSEIEIAQLTSEAEEIEETTKLASLTEARNAELNYQKELNSLEIEKAKALAKIEMNKVAKMIDSIGSDTLNKIAVSGPEAKVKMLQSLNIQNTLISDGSTPINLYQGSGGSFMRA